jgi:hypothetical protein
MRIDDMDKNKRNLLMVLILFYFSKTPRVNVHSLNSIGSPDYRGKNSQNDLQLLYLFVRVSNSGYIV